MGRPAAPGKSGERNFIPIIFTIGVIGWGFFAIARMTDNGTEVIPRRNTKVERQESGMLTSFKLWLLDKLTGQRKESAEVKLKTLPPVKEIPRADDLPVIEDPLAGVPLIAQPEILPEIKKPPQELQELKESQDSPAEKPDSLTNVKVYLYALDKQGTPRLKSVRREISGGDPVMAALQAVIRGPSAAEELRDFIDSFPAKPKILSLQQKDDTLIINFSDNFGVGVSHATLKFQIQQLLHTAMQFGGIRAVSIRINGKQSRHLGGDGIAVPERIDLNSLKNF